MTQSAAAASPTGRPCSPPRRARSQFIRSTTSPASTASQAEALYRRAGMPERMDQLDGESRGPHARPARHGRRRAARLASFAAAAASPGAARASPRTAPPAGGHQPRPPRRAGTASSPSAPASGLRSSTAAPPSSSTTTIPTTPASSAPSTTRCARSSPGLYFGPACWKGAGGSTTTILWFGARHARGQPVSLALRDARHVLVTGAAGAIGGALAARARAAWRPAARLTLVDVDRPGLAAIAATSAAPRPPCGTSPLPTRSARSGSRSTGAAAGRRPGQLRGDHGAANLRRHVVGPGRQASWRWIWSARCA